MKTDYMRYLKAIAGFIILVLIDLITKVWAVKTLSSDPIVLIKGIFELRYLENRGAAFGLLQNQRTFFLVLTIVFLAVMIFLYLKLPSDRKYLPLRILIVVVSAGAFGNFYDRLTLTYVRDFLYFSLIDFPIFNVADIYVTCSAILFFILIMFVYKEEDLDFKRKAQ